MNPSSTDGVSNKSGSVHSGIRPAQSLVNVSDIMDRKLLPLKPVLTSGDTATFRAILDGAAARPETGVISNRFPWQSKMAAEKLLEIAKAQQFRIRVLSGRCPEGFYTEDFTRRFTECRNAGCKPIRVLVWQKTAHGISPALVKLADEGTVELKISGTEDFAGQVPHFLLVGDRAFRQEAAHPPFTTNTVFTATEPQVPARIDFDDLATGEVLANFFDKLWEAK